jgi:hypothetical protein
MEFIVLQYPRNAGFVFAPLCKDLSWQNRFSMTSLFTLLGMMEESDLVNLCLQNSLNPVTREEISCLVWCDIKNFSRFFTDDLKILETLGQYQMSG